MFLVCSGVAVTSAFAQVDLTGEWTAVRNGVVVAKCSIRQTGGQLEFVIHRNPEERSRGRFLNANTIVASDWGEQGTIAEGGNLIRWTSSEWRRANPPPTNTSGTPVSIDLTGEWTAVRNGAVLAKCSIRQTGGQLEFIIHRNPEERSRGRFLNANTIVASDWGDQGVIAEGGNLIRWRNSEWRRGDTTGGKAGDIGLNGCWNKCSIHFFQDGERAYYTASWKNGPQEWHPGWVIQRGEGWLKGRDLVLENVVWAPVYLKGSPQPKTQYYMRLSEDGNVLQGYAVVNGRKGPILTWARDE